MRKTSMLTPAVTEDVLFALQQDIHRNAMDKGFWPVYDLNASVRALALIHSEVSEALEVLRRNGTDAEFGDELADIVIRTLDLAAASSLNLGHHVVNKLEANKNRPYKHGKRF